MADLFVLLLLLPLSDATSPYMERLRSSNITSLNNFLQSDTNKNERQIGGFVVATNHEEPQNYVTERKFDQPEIMLISTSTAKSQEIRENFHRTFTLPPPIIKVERMDQLTVDPTSSNVLTNFTGKPDDCLMPQISFCNQQAWTDYGLSLSGIIPKTVMCSKYLPSDSCMSTYMAQCGKKMDSMTRHMLIALAKVVVYWCANPDVLAAADEYTTCYSMALIEAVTFDKCLSGVQFPKSIVRAFFQTKKDERNGGGPGGPMIPNLINNLIGGFTTSTLSCMSDTIKTSCGIEAAKFAIGPALEEIEMAKPKSAKNPSLTTLISLLDPQDQYNTSALNNSDTDSFVQILDFSKSCSSNLLAFSHTFVVSLCICAVFISSGIDIKV